MRFIDLFAGVGGFRLAMEHAGHECVWSCEIDRWCKYVYKYQFGEEPTGDIRGVDVGSIPDHDCLCAGFPCQSFSVAGRRGGLEEARGTLFYEICRVAGAKRPQMLLLENVKGLLSSNGGRDFETICESLNSLGYIINYDIYNSKDFGVPQNRERVFFICTHITALIKDGMPKRTKQLEMIIGDFLFQLLLNNLEGVKRLQERESKDSVIGLLLLREIGSGMGKKLKFLPKTTNYLLAHFKDFFQSELIVPSIINLDNWDLKGEDIKGGILILTEGRGFQLDTEKVWQNIDTLLKSIWEENYLGKNKFTISTATKQITEWKTYTYSQMLLSMLTLVVHLRRSSNTSWKRILSNLILMKENTKYARISDRTEEGIVTESNNSYKCDISKEAEKHFIIEHLGGFGGQQIFPLREGDGVPTEANRGECEGGAGISSKDCASAIDARYGAPRNAGETYIAEEPMIYHHPMNYGKKSLYRGDEAHPSLRTISRSPKILDDTEVGAVPKVKDVAPSLRANSHGNRAKVIHNEEYSPTIRTPKGGGHLPMVVADRTRTYADLGRNLETPKPITNALSGIQKDNLLIKNMRIRRLTPRECERLQSFSDDFTRWGINENGDKIEISDTQRYKMMGNAVTVNVVGAIAKAIKEPKS